MKCLVTGGAGFIGSHIAQALCARGAQVVVLDNLSLGSLKNLVWKKGSDALEFVQGEITDGRLVRDLIQGCDWVFHEAALPSVPLSVAKPLETNRANLDAGLELLVAARDAKVKRFLFASSSAIYGDSEAPLKHEFDLPRPLSPYALQKYATEKYAQMFWQLYGLETVSLRYFNVFGPLQSFDSPYSGVIARFCTAILQSQPLTIFGDGLQSRDFVYIENVVQANLLGAEQATEQVAGKVFNIGCGVSITLLQLLGELNRLTGQSIAPRFEPARIGDVRSSQPDLTAAAKHLAFKPKISWQEGLRETLEFYRSEARGVQ